MSILICSKAPWGLSVLSRVVSIFTDTSISPGVLSRQCRDRYAFRAGQNLPDKEFRYLRTVIVTAAVYSGLVSTLRDSFQNLIKSSYQLSVISYQLTTTLRLPYYSLEILTFNVLVVDINIFIISLKFSYML